MNAAELLTTLQAEGLRLGLDNAGGLQCRGDRATVSAFLPAIRQHKPELLAILTGKVPGSVPEPKTEPPKAEPDPLNPTNDPELSRLLSLPPGERLRALMWAGYRMEFEGGKLARVVRLADIEAEQGDQHQGAVVHAHQGDTDTGRVCCGDCGHFQRDRIGDGSGIGRCAVLDNPPGGLLWPRGERRCSKFERITAGTSTSEATP
jgi:hypothetical protein